MVKRMIYQLKLYENLPNATVTAPVIVMHAQVSKEDRVGSARVASGGGLTKLLHAVVDGSHRHISVVGRRESVVWVDA